MNRNECTRLSRKVKLPDRRELGICLILFLLSLGARLLYLRDISSTLFFENPVVDEYIYDQMATAILAGLPEQDGVFRPPLYPLFLSFVYRVFGHSVSAARVVQMVLGAFCTLLLYRLAQRFLERRVAVLAALFYAFSWPAIYFQGELLDISIFPILLVLTVYWFLRSLESGKPLYASLAGMFLGLSALARGTALFFFPAVAFFLLGSLGRRKAAGLLAIFTAAAMCPLLFSGYRNYRLSGEFILLSSNGAINFYVGNNPAADGLNSIPPGLVWNKVVGEPVRQGLVSAGDQSRYWLTRSLAYITENPGRSILLYLKKCYAFWNAVEVSSNKDIYCMREQSRFLSLPLVGFGMIGPLVILSLLFTRNRGTTLPCIWALILSYMLANSLFFTTARYRAAVIPFVAILASHAVLSLYDAARSREKAILWKSFLIFPLAVFFVNADPLDLEGQVMTRPHFQLGQILLSKGRYEEALREMEKDLERRPDDPDILNNLGVVYKRMGDRETAKRYYEMALGYGEYGGVRWNLGLLAYEEGDYEAARLHWRKALEEEPLNPAIKKSLAAVEELLPGN